MLVFHSLNSLQTSSEMLALQPRNQVTWFRDGHPPHPPRPDLVGAGSAAPAEDTEASPQCRLTKRGQLALSRRAGGINENRFVFSFGGRTRAPSHPRAMPNLVRLCRARRFISRS